MESLEIVRERENWISFGTKGRLMKKNKIDLFLDSGAFSAFTQGIQIDIQEYIDFIKEHEDVLDVYANLDVIGSAEGTWKNQRIMERAGLNPLPCFHYGEDLKWLKRYINKYEYIALGGMVPISTPQLAIWLDDIFSQYICDEEGMPKVKIHGFGLTSLKLLLRYPWYSVDSTSWVVTGRMGSILVPKRINGQWDFLKEPYKITMSSRSPNKKKGEYIEALSPTIKKLVLDYIEELGHSLGKSSFRPESIDYKLEEGEKWGSKPGKETRIVETIEKEGLSNHYRFRDEANIHYFLEMEKQMPEWPIPFKIKTKRGLGLQ